MAKPVLVFAPCAYNLAETTRMTAIAKAVRRLPGAPFELQFIGTVMTAGYAGRPIVGVGMQPEQTANLAAVERKGIAIRVPKSKDPSARIHKAISSLLDDHEARRRAEEFARSLDAWDGPSRAAEVIASTFQPAGPGAHGGSRSALDGAG